MSNSPDRPLFDRAEKPDESSMRRLQHLRGKLDETEKALSEALPLPNEIFVVINAQLVVVGTQIKNGQRTAHITGESLTVIRTQIEALNRMITDAVHEKNAKHRISSLNS